MPYSTATGLRIWYEAAGDGPPLVLVHANPFDHRLWTYQTARFSAWFRVISMDLRGYGRSDKPETPFTLADMAADVRGVCRTEGVGAGVFCGCSVGSGIVLLIALDHPEMVRGLVLVGGNSKGSANVRKRVEGFLAATNLEGFLKGYLKELVAPGFLDTPVGRWVLATFTENAQALSGRAIAQIHRARGDCDMSGRLSELRLPTLVINGAHDNSLAAGRTTAAGISGARHVVLPGAGHACCIEDPRAFDAAVLGFLSEHDLMRR